ncbi:hypothetical protein NPIL_452901 [Nephila pilipes]|uniref:Uncharacterized protein n=1 Tax=Nephila pilipes TaxID=299642 RepID=A0A8X6MU49_NEPPI|nr:hypothetical protein NPIL_452901 [Nephila pilipes]
MLRSGFRSRNLCEEIKPQQVIDKQPLSKRNFDCVTINISPDKGWVTNQRSQKAGSYLELFSTIFYKDRKSDCKFLLEIGILVALILIIVIFVLSQKDMLPTWLPNINYLLGFAIALIFLSLLVALSKTACLSRRISSSGKNNPIPLEDDP